MLIILFSAIKSTLKIKLPVVAGLFVVLNIILDNFELDTVVTNLPSVVNESFIN